MKFAWEHFFFSLLLLLLFCIELHWEDVKEDKTKLIYSGWENGMEWDSRQRTIITHGDRYTYISNNSSTLCAMLSKKTANELWRPSIIWNSLSFFLSLFVSLSFAVKHKQTVRQKSLCAQRHLRYPELWSNSNLNNTFQNLNDFKNKRSTTNLFVCAFFLLLHRHFGHGVEKLTFGVRNHISAAYNHVNKRRRNVIDIKLKERIHTQHASDLWNTQIKVALDLNLRIQEIVCECVACEK